MGIVVDVPQAGMDYVLYGDKSNLISGYLYNQLQALPKAFNAFSERVYNNLTTSYNFINDKLTQYGIMNQIQSNGVKIVDNYFEQLTTFQQLQNANLVMQRWVMANPQMKELYNNQNLDGYSDTFKNVSGKGVGESDYNYRMVMDGVVTPTDDGFIIKNYLEDHLLGDKELSTFEKTKILNTWDAIDWILETSKYDFTVKSESPVKMNKD